MGVERVLAEGREVAFVSSPAVSPTSRPAGIPSALPAGHPLARHGFRHRAVAGCGGARLARLPSGKGGPAPAPVTHLLFPQGFWSNARHGFAPLLGAPLPEAIWLAR